MYGFVVVLIFIIFGFALIAVEFDQAQVPYGYQLYGTFKILFANYNDEDFNVSQKLFFSVIVFLLNVVLLNLLISIMGDTYDKVQERRVLIDSLTRLDMALEAIVYMKTLGLTGRNQGKGYLIYCETESVDEDYNMQDIEWEGRINVIKKLMRQNDAKIQEVVKSVEKGNMSAEEQMSALKKQVSAVETQVSTMEKEMKDQAKEMKNQAIAMEGLKDQVGSIEKEMKNQATAMEGIKDQVGSMEKDIKEVLGQIRTLSLSQPANTSN